MIVLDGQPALSPFRLERLNAGLAAPGQARVVAARWRYFVDGAVDAPELARLGAILEARPAAAAGAQALLVLPRLGTVSPWSSKASEIVRGCGLALGRVERGTVLMLEGLDAAAALAEPGLSRRLHDPMTQSLLAADTEPAALFAPQPRLPLGHVALGTDAEAALAAANRLLGLALSPDEIEYLAQRYRGLGRDPTDVELMMFAQANSEHCRHKVFNASWRIDGEALPETLFGMIKATHRAAPAHTLTAYADNAAVIEGSMARRFLADPVTRRWQAVPEPAPYAIKVETHNHPTAIAPFPGASTGSGGEIRDEGATGRGGKPKAGLTGFSVSHLRIPGLAREWERPRPLPPRYASAFEIMRDGPLGAAAFNNEFGRPALLGYFRCFEHFAADATLVRGYDKPIMLAGGIANLRPGHVAKLALAPGDLVIVLGGPAMLIGLGGGAASSVAAGSSSEALDFASVQRDNPEMQRRCQEVLDRCTALGDANPIVTVHDVGAGGLSNAIPELLHDSGLGGRIELRDVPSDDAQLSPLQIWCNEAQERYVLGIRPDRLAEFEALCARERCPYAVVGVATAAPQLLVSDRLLGAPAVDIPLDLLFGKPPRMQRDARRRPSGLAAPFDVSALDLGAALERVLRHPTVASKAFLVTIGDRSVGGLCARDPMVGRWQVPVADCALTLVDFDGHAGEAMALGERTPLALLAPAAAARMAVGEALTNLMGVPLESLEAIKLSANWMAAAGHPGEDAALFDAVRAIGLELCPALGLSIPVGKDSMSMQVAWRDGGTERRVVAPVSPVISAFARVADVRRAVTPELQLDQGPTELWLIDLGAGLDRLGGSILLECHGALGDTAPDVDDPARLAALFHAMQELHAAGLVLACHDRSDGGLLVTLLEMAFAARVGLDLALPGAASPAALFAEELGLVLQVAAARRAALEAVLSRHGLLPLARCIGRVEGEGETARLAVRAGDALLLDRPVPALYAAWTETTHAMQRLRDNPECADEERAAALDWGAPGISPLLVHDPAAEPVAPAILHGLRPRLAVLREQGVNGQVEMAAAFNRAGFDAEDVHMTDLIDGRAQLSAYAGLVACGGFSYGDVLGAGRGWATSIRYREALAEQFGNFLADTTRFALGVCNGCQMMAALKSLVPGAEAWPRLERNRSEQYEARLAEVEILPSPSLFFAGMAGSRLPVVVAHGEGRAVFERAGDQDRVLAALRFVDAGGRPAVAHPANPNGSPGGLTGFTNTDGRVTILMPHPERVFRSVQLSWRPRGWGEDSPWMRMFRNARAWVG